MPDTHENTPQENITENFVCTLQKCAVLALRQWVETLPKGSKISNPPKDGLCLHKGKVIDFHKSEGGCGDSFRITAVIFMKKTEQS